jgi:hypothetical protein
VVTTHDFYPGNTINMIVEQDFAVPRSVLAELVLLAGPVKKCELYPSFSGSRIAKVRIYSQNKHALQPFMIWSFKEVH